MSNQLTFWGPNNSDLVDKSTFNHWIIDLKRSTLDGSVQVNVSNGDRSYPFTFPSNFSIDQILNYYVKYGVIKSCDTIEFVYK